ncbi:uncharacterized protein F54H12.2-like [Haliotis rufescens]|uniref:uncharacterized protein F54H12.2-like n=1 Tax=Haliotis rufescens TaxID=6454 RepID=UPI001EAFE2AA|nr:uncharacterized protein F54H12.2-like [Haliotis rufescens]
MIRADATQCSKSELDLFSVPAVVTSMRDSGWVRYTPTTTITGGGPIRFDVVNPVNNYIDLSQCYLRVVFKIVKGDGTDVAATDNVGPVNNVLHSMFREVRVMLGQNQTEITPSLGTYPYRAYIENCLTYSADVMSNVLQCQGWYRDEGGKMNDINMQDGVCNLGMKRRHGLVAPTREVEVTGRLHCDLFLQPRYLLDGVPLKIELVRSADSFWLMHDDAESYRGEITKIEFHTRQVEISAGIREGHIKGLKRGLTAKYPISRIRTTAHDISAGLRDYHCGHLVTGELPKRIVLGLVDNTAFAGRSSLNPFDFKHKHVTSVKVTVNGHEVHKKSLEVNYDADSSKVNEVYMDLFRNTGGLWRNGGPPINRKQFMNGYTLYVIDFSDDLGADEGHTYPIESGKVGIEIHFSQPLQNPVTLVCYQEGSCVIEVDAFRNVSIS